MEETSQQASMSGVLVQNLRQDLAAIAYVQSCAAEFEQSRTEWLLDKLRGAVADRAKDALITARQAEVLVTGQSSSALLEEARQNAVMDVFAIQATNSVTSVDPRSDPSSIRDADQLVAVLKQDLAAIAHVEERMQEVGHISALQERPIDNLLTHLVELETRLDNLRTALCDQARTALVNVGLTPAEAVVRLLPVQGPVSVQHADVETNLRFARHVTDQLGSSSQDASHTRSQERQADAQQTREAPEERQPNAGTTQIDRPKGRDTRFG